MKKYTISLCTTIITLFVLSGCQKIDLLPKDNLPDPLYWKTPSDYIKQVNQLYSQTETFGTKDTDSDIGYELNENTVSNGTYTAPNQDGDWNSAFSNLRHSNTIIEKSASYEGSFEEIERYVAEARFFRAYFHWRLLRKFNDAPIITKVLEINDDDLYGGRKSQAEVEDFILSELESIYPLLPTQSQLTNNENGRITQGAALGLKARVALFAGTWAKNHQHRTDYNQLLDQAISAASKVMESNEYRLYEGAGSESYRQLFIDQGDDSPEDIFVSRYHKEIRMHSTAHSVFWGWRGTPTKKMADLYLSKTTGLPISHSGSGFHGYAEMDDEYMDRDPRMTQTFMKPGTQFLNANGPELSVPQFTTRPETRTGYKLWKFMGETVGGVDDATYNYRIIRYPEILLILAEASFEKDNAISNALLDQTINVIRGRLGVEMPPLSNEFVTTHGLDMRNELRRERTVELAFEGFRRDDLRRWKTAETELQQAIRGIKYKGTEYEELQVLNSGNPGLVDGDGFLIVEPAANRVFTAPKHYYFSLPLDEIYLNSSLLPNNPGW